MPTTDLGARVLQVRAVVDLLPEMEVVEGDSFNSSPTDPKLMGPDALMRFK
jgi:magnesium chelatase subunit I